VKTLLHTCCGPCASACVPRLKEKGREVTLLFANSNIDTREEFEKRLNEAKKLAQAEGVKIVALPYDHEAWLRTVARGYEHEPEKGARCARCFRYNLQKAAEYASQNGYDDYTTSLTVSPHKVSKVIFEAGRAIPLSSFLAEDFKKNEGFKLSVRRATELGLYRQSYCGCEFSKMPNTPPSAFLWRLHHKRETTSTNEDAREGRPGDVFTADFQTAGRGRLNHKWLSPPGTNLMMSAVLSVEGLKPDHVATLPLVIGLAVVKSLSHLLIRTFEHFPPQPPNLPTSQLPNPHSNIRTVLKWPNDVLIEGKKVAGILCERVDDRVIVGLGINVKQQKFAPEIEKTATSLGSVPHFTGSVPMVRDAVLSEIGALYQQWRAEGFASIYPQIAEVDFLRGQTLAVRQTDEDQEPIRGLCGGILPDGALDVGGIKVYAGETHVERIGL